MTYEELNDNIGKKIVYIKEQMKINKDSEPFGEEFFKGKLVVCRHIQNDIAKFTNEQKANSELLDEINRLCIIGLLSELDDDY